MNNPTSFLPPPSQPSPTAAPVGPATEDVRGRWLANVGPIPGLGNGAGPVTLTIDTAGVSLTLANLAPGASFASYSAMLSTGELRLQLIGASGGCAPGSDGVYRLTESLPATSSRSPP